MKFQHAFAAIAFCAVSLGASATPVGTDLVTNGDFSDGGNNWTLTGNQGFNSYPGYWSNGAVGSDAYLSQVIATVAGRSYQITFDTMVSWGTMAGSLDGMIFVTTPSSGHFTSVVTAANSNATLTFITRNDPGFNHLDNVSVIDVTRDVPEPASFALLGLGLAGVALMRRKKA